MDKRKLEKLEDKARRLGWGETDGWPVASERLGRWLEAEKQVALLSALEQDTTEAAAALAAVEAEPGLLAERDAYFAAVENYFRRDPDRLRWTLAYNSWSVDRYSEEMKQELAEAFREYEE